MDFSEEYNFDYTTESSIKYVGNSIIYNKVIDHSIEPPVHEKNTRQADHL